MEYATYFHLDVDRLSRGDGRALLRKLGVRGPDEALDRVVEEWDGYALALTLIGTYLADRYDGDINRIEELPKPTTNERRYERIQRVLRSYDDHLTDAERAFLMQLSAFRTHVERTALAPVFRDHPTSLDDLNVPLANLDDGQFNGLLERLTQYRMLRYNSRTNSYTMHPLIQTYFLDRLNESSHTQLMTVHERIKEYYLAIARFDSLHPTLESIAPVLEAVHHACSAGRYDEALQIVWTVVLRGAEVITHRLGAFDANLRMVEEFFPRYDISREPLVDDPLGKYWLLNEAGISLLSLGRLRETPELLERAAVAAKEIASWHNVSITYENLSHTYAFRGDLAASAEKADQALAFGQRANNLEKVRTALVCQAWVSHLKGELERAGSLFQQAEVLEHEIWQRSAASFADALSTTVEELPFKLDFLWAWNGVRYADHLRLIGRWAYAKRVTEANIAVCEALGLLPMIALCHRILGDLDVHDQQYDTALAHYDEAVRIGRTIVRRDIRIDALLARGRYYLARRDDVEPGQGDLYEALDYAVPSGYALYEVDIRVELARLLFLIGSPQEGEQHLESAQRAAESTNYYWGSRSAAEVQATLYRSDPLPDV